VCAKNHPDRLSRLATIHQRYRRTDGRISYGIGLDLTVGQKSHAGCRVSALQCWYQKCDVINTIVCRLHAGCFALPIVWHQLNTALQAELVKTRNHYAPRPRQCNTGRPCAESLEWLWQNNFVSKDSYVHSLKPNFNITGRPCVSKSTRYTPLCSIITLANVDRFSKFFHQLLRREILYVYITKICTSPDVWKNIKT